MDWKHEHIKLLELSVVSFEHLGVSPFKPPDVDSVGYSLPPTLICIFVSPGAMEARTRLKNSKYLVTACA